jgi:hypothetical protein
LIVGAMLMVLGGAALITAAVFKHQGKLW